MRLRFAETSNMHGQPSPLAGEGGEAKPSRVRGLAASPQTTRLGSGNKSPLTHPPAAGALSREGRGQKAAVLAGALAGVLLVPTAAWAAAGGQPVDPFVFRLSVFVMAIFVGYYVVWSVTPALHTPLMSVTNAISSVIVVGALLAVGIEHAGAAIEGETASKVFGWLALVMASVNIFGGFLVTQRMLAMYKKKEKK
jgi:H+-translocating NAD(P) transhydrogenase subunit alpha